MSFTLPDEKDERECTNVDILHVTLGHILPHPYEGDFRGGQSDVCERVQRIITEKEVTAVTGGRTKSVRLSTGPTTKSRSSNSLLDYVLFTLKRRPIILISKFTKGNPVGCLCPRIVSCSICHHCVQQKLYLENAGPFFEEGKLNDAPSTRDDELKVRIGMSLPKLSSHPIKFDLMDSTQTYRFSHNDWKAVVAVCLTGAEWQIKGYPWDSIETMSEHVL